SAWPPDPTRWRRYAPPSGARTSRHSSSTKRPPMASSNRSVHEHYHRPRDADPRDRHIRPRRLRHRPRASGPRGGAGGCAADGAAGNTPAASALGTWAIGGWMWGGTDGAESIAAIRAGLDEGVTLIDTAPAYGMGRAEQIVGKAIAGRRDDVVLATKCGLVWH